MLEQNKRISNFEGDKLQQFWKGSFNQRLMMKLDLENLFLKISETSSLTKASQELGITVAAVSKQLKQLEVQLGQSLIVRNSRVLRLTEAGELYREACNEIVNSRKVFKEKLSEIDGDVKGLIRLTVPPVFASFVLAPLMRDFLSQYPESHFSITTNHQNTDLVSEPFDLAIRLGKLEDSSLNARKLTDCKMHLCAETTYASSLGKLNDISDLVRKQVNYIIVDGIGLSKTILDGYFRKISLRPEQISVRTNDTRLQLESVLQGLGVSVLPDYLIDGYINQGVVVTLLPEIKLPTLPLNVMYPGSKQLPFRIRAFIDFLCAHYSGSTLSKDESKNKSK
jgi:DNA-binding transcriptional LysR family regulator